MEIVHIHRYYIFNIITWISFQVLYEELQLDKKLPLKTKIAKTNVAHQKSTSEAMLNQLCEVHPLPAIVLEYRQVLVQHVEKAHFVQTDISIVCGESTLSIDRCQYSMCRKYTQYRQVLVEKLHLIQTGISVMCRTHTQ